MRFAICNELFQDWPWERTRAYSRMWLHRLGDRPLFTLGGRPDLLPPERRQQLADQVSRSGVEVVGLHWLLAKTEGYHLTTNDQEVARYAHVPLLGTISPTLSRLRGLNYGARLSGATQLLTREMTHDQAAANACHVLEQALPELEKHGVTLALEPLGPGEGNFWNDASQTVEVIEKISSPWVQLHLDVKAMSTEELVKDCRHYSRQREAHGALSRQ